jgi:dienelactone hydrolase
MYRPNKNHQNPGGIKKKIKKHALKGFTIILIFIFCFSVVGLAIIRYLGRKTEEKVEKVKESLPEEKLKKLLPESVLSAKGIGIIDVNYRERDLREARARIYFPLDLSKQYPAVIWCSGWKGWREGVPPHQNELETLSKHGYIVMIFKATSQDELINGMVEGMKGEWTEDMQDAITYLTFRSPVKRLVDWNKIGLVGYSLGGITVSRITADPRVKACVILSCTDLSQVGQLKIPIQIQSSDFDVGGFLITFENAPSYLLANPPKQLIVIDRGNHFFGKDTPNESFISNWFDGRKPPYWQDQVSLYYMISWFDYYLKRDEKALERIKTPTDYLSTRWNSKYDLGRGEGEILMAGPGVKQDRIVPIGRVEELLRGGEQ